MMTQSQPRLTTMTQSITLDSGFCTREAIVMMAKGISNSIIIRALVFTQINVESVSNKRARRFDEVKNR